MTETELIVCPLCLKVIHRHSAQPIESRARVSSRTTNAGSADLLTEMMLDMERAHQQRIQAAEQACVEHYASSHKVRFWLWRKLHWDRLMNNRWIVGGATGGDKFSFSQGDG